MISAIIFVSGILMMVILIVENRKEIARLKEDKANLLREIEGRRTFSHKASEYYDSMEKAEIDILKEQEPIDKTITLWWGLDGLRLNEDGTLEWISRKKPKPVMQNVFYQPCQSIQDDIESQLRIHSQTQSTRAQIEELMMRNAALQNQATQYMQSASMIGAFAPHPMPVYTYYSPYMQPPYMQSAYPLTQCYCNCWRPK